MQQQTEPLGNMAERTGVVLLEDQQREMRQLGHSNLFEQRTTVPNNRVGSHAEREAKLVFKPPFAAVPRTKLLLS